MSTGTRRVASSPRSARSTSRPDSLGISMSSKTRSGCSLRARRSPSSPSAGGRHRQPSLPKARLARAAKESIVLDQQDPFARCLHGRHPLIGSVKMNVEPRPSSDSHQTWPASFSTMRRTR